MIETPVGVTRDTLTAAPATASKMFIEDTLIEDTETASQTSKPGSNQGFDSPQS